MLRPVAVLTTTLALLVTGRAAADPCGPPVPLGDLNQYVYGGLPLRFFPSGTHTFFAAAVPDSNREPWVTDGTSSGTQPLADIVPGEFGSEPVFITAVGNVVLFFADNVQTLWRSDGTPAGTFELAQARLGAGSWSGITLGGVAYFAAETDAEGSELWRSDGSVAGTFRLVDIAQGPSPSYPFDWLVLSGAVYFTAGDPSSGNELWRTDGTAAGTVRLTDVCGGTCNGVLHAGLAARGGLVYFGGSDGTTSGLFAYDPGSSTVSLVRSFNAGSPTWVRAFSNVLYLGADDGTSGVEFWKSDGTLPGTMLVRDINPGAPGSGPRIPVEWGGRLFFRATEAATGSEPWTSDGTQAGTYLLADTRPGPAGTSTPPGPFVATPNGVVFGAVGATFERRLWHTDGTPAGTATLLTDVFVGDNLGPGADGVYFSGSDIDSLGALWKTDGTLAGTTRVSPLARITSTSYPSPFVQVGSDVLFTALGDPTGAPAESGIWKTDGTPSGTSPLRSGPSLPLTIFRGLAYGVGPGPLASATVADEELWRSDGTTAGTGLFAVLDPGATHDSPHGFLALGNRALYFTADDGVTGKELWSSDGTIAGTALVVDLEPGPAGASPLALAPLGDRLLFVASPSAADGALYATDGTAAGTVLLVDPAPGPAEAIFRGSAVLDGRLYAQFYEGVFSTDGTPAGTTGLSLPGVDWFDCDLLAGMNGKLFISHSPVGRDDELLAYDPLRGTTEVLGSYQRTAAVSIGYSHVNGTTLYFTASDGMERHALYRTDGTAAGTELVAALWDGSWWAGPRAFVSVGPEVWFSASDPGTGRELWRSNGSLMGTVRVTDINPGPADGIPATEEIAYLGGRIYLAADDGLTSTEPWSLCVTALRPALLRNTSARPPASGATELLPLTLIRDRYVDDFASGGEDPAPIVEDVTRPLVFYALDGGGELRLAKTQALGIRIEF